LFDPLGGRIAFAKYHSPFLALGCLVAAPARGFAEELQQEFQQDLSDFSDTTLTRQQWRQRVEDARRRSEAFVAQARSHRTDSIQSEQENAELKDQLAMNDPSLKPGDIVSTSHGLLVFIGRDGAGADRMTLSELRKSKWNGLDGWSAS
jgi:hypothetical protein